MNTNQEIIYNGALIDNRPLAAKQNDFSYDEFLGFGVYEWKEKPRDTWRKYPIRNQNGSGMCGAFAGCKALGINNFYENGKFVNLNTAFVYNLRSNSTSGMWLYELLSIMKNHGAPLDESLSSDNLTDEQSKKITFTESQKKEALKFRAKSFHTFSPNIDKVAELVDSKITPILLVRCAYREWTDEPTYDPTVKEYVDYSVNHFVPVTEVTLIDGKKRVIIEDSWGQQYGNKGERKLTEEFFKKRVYSVGYVVDLINKDTEKPSFVFKKTLSFGSKGNDVVQLQKLLQYEGFLATHTSNGNALNLGNFATMTADALKKWQVSHGIMDFANETNLRKIRFGLKSMTKANTLYK